MSQHSRLDNFIVLRGLGKGATAKVKAVQDPTTQQVFAAKILKNQGEALSARFREVVQNEMSSLNRIQHPNVVNLINANENGVYVKKNGSMYNCMYMVIELCPNGELFDILFQSGKFDEKTTRFYFRQMIEALEACHNSGIAHRDMKPENVLFDENFNLKISDFGFSIILSGRDGSGQLNTHLGTEGYMAPEIHLRKPYAGETVDLFATGIILFIMFSQNPPFTKAIPNDPYYRLLSSRDDRFWQLHSRNKSPTFYSADFKSLITSMLALEPSQRLTIQAIKQHPWYNGPMSTAQEIGAELKSRRLRIVEAAERAKEQRMKMSGNRPGIVYQSGKFFRGDTSDLGDMSLSFSVPPEDLVARPLPSDFSIVNKYTQLLTGLHPQEIMTIISHCLSNAEAECEISNENYEVTARVVTETDSVSFKVSIYEARDSLSVVAFSLLKGNHFELMSIFRSVAERIEEVQAA